MFLLYLQNYTISTSNSYILEQSANENLISNHRQQKGWGYGVAAPCTWFYKCSIEFSFLPWKYFLVCQLAPPNLTILLCMPLSGIHDISVTSLNIYFQKIICMNSSYCKINTGHNQKFYFWLWILVVVIFIN